MAYTLQKRVVPQQTNWFDIKESKRVGSLINLVPKEYSSEEVARGVAKFDVANLESTEYRVLKDGEPIAHYVKNPTGQKAVDLLNPPEWVELTLDLLREHEQAIVGPDPDEVNRTLRRLGFIMWFYREDILGAYKRLLVERVKEHADE